MSKNRCSKFFSMSLEEISSKIPSEGINFKDFLDMMGDRGGLIVSMIFATPFLIPVSIPGSSQILGLGIMFIGINRVFSRYLIPKKVMDYKLPKNMLIKIISGTISILNRFEKYIQPRFLILTKGSSIMRFNNILMVYTAFLLALPLPIPLTDSLPGYSIFLLAAGILECDGYLVLAGYLMVSITTIYFTLMVLVGYAGVSFISSYLGLYLP